MNTCERCGYDSEHKQNLIRHLRNKSPCKPLISNKSRQALIDELTKKEYNDITYGCEHCSKKFNNRSSMYRHMKNCKSKVDIVKNLETEIKALKVELQEIKTKTLTTGQHEKHIKFRTETVIEVVY